MTPERKRSWTDADLEEYVRRSCAEQGVPVKVTDPVVLDRVTTLMALPPRTTEADREVNP